jgi:hypothetical protein
MKKTFILLVISSILVSFCVSKSKNDNQYLISFIKDVYIDKSSEGENGTDKSDHFKGRGEKIDYLIGIFPRTNDTITIYKLNKNLTNESERISFWSNRLNKNSIFFYCSSNDSLKVIFNKKNEIIIGNDRYFVNEEYYKFLIQKIYHEKSILDLAFFLKDGYGDYADFLEPLNKNWRNQKENTFYRIISAKIKNRDFQSDDQFFDYSIYYKYNKKGKLLSIKGDNRFNKKFLYENSDYLNYSIENGYNERSNSLDTLFKNKKTLFDSIVGSYVQYSTSKTTYYAKYQSSLKTLSVKQKPNKLEEIFKLLEIK